MSRASVRLGDGRVGHGYVLGRDMAHAEQIAVIDALMQDDGDRARVLTAVGAPLRARHDRRVAERRRAAARTKVDFFTLAREGDVE